MKKYVEDNSQRVTQQKFNEYYPIMNKRLGNGSFGVVYLYTSKTNKSVAIKEIQKVQINKAGTMGFDYEALFMEVNANSCIREIIRKNPEHADEFVLLNGFFNISDQKFIMAMNYYPESLNDFQKRVLQSNYNYMSHEKQKITDNIILKLAQGMQFMHDNNLSHRDMKLENVMMSGNNPMIMDFGLTTPEADLFSTMAGTPFFVDPLLVKTGKGGKHTDVYALGIMFYVLLNGSSSYQNLERMMMQGGWQGDKRRYNPNIASLSFPKKYGTLKNMLSMSGDRMNMDDVVAEILKIQGKGKLEEIKEVHLYAGEDNFQPKKAEVKNYAHAYQELRQKRDKTPEYKAQYPRAPQQDNQALLMKMKMAEQKQVPNQVVQNRGAYQYEKQVMSKPSDLPLMDKYLAQKAQERPQFLHEQKKVNQYGQEVKSKIHPQQKKPEIKYEYPAYVYQNQNQRGMPVERVVQPKPVNVYQAETNRVQNLAMQNKARHYQDNNIFGNPRYRNLLI
jgi:serine/threonine protein kinase